jgi:hypothetical protein
VHALLGERGNLAAVAAIDDADLRVAVHFAHEAHAPRAQDAAVAVEHQRRTEVDVGADALAVERPARKIHPAVGIAEVVGEILQRAFPAFVADRAVERVIDQQELEDAGAPFHRLGVCRVDDHAIGDRRRARRLQLRHLFDLDQADAARRIDTQPRVIAVIRDLDAGFDRGLQDRCSLGHRDRTAIDGQRHVIHDQPGIISKGRRTARTRAPLTVDVYRRGSRR